MNEAELEQCRALLGVTAAATAEDLERAFMKKNFALIKGNTGDEPKRDVSAERERLRLAHEKLAEHLKQQTAVKPPPRLAPAAGPTRAAAEAAWSNRPGPGALPNPGTAAITPPVVTPRDPADDEPAWLRFDHWGVNTFVPPLLLALAWLVNASPLGFFMKGFHVWMHEFGHATAAWMCGFKATPLPFGWTPVEPVYSHFVYFGLLALFGVLFIAGLKERKAWAMLLAVLLIGVQFYMTRLMPEYRQEFWWSAFGGVGGEFYLSTLFMIGFWVQLPEKFRWGACRYLLFFIGASAFLNIWLRWRDVYRGLEEIPFGSMINGEDDQGGDMNKLRDGFGWSKFQIRRNYLMLGWACWAVLAVMWAIFALRLNKVADWVAERFGKAET